jgi:AraC family ethanolamine operon transcriptional activator
MAAYAQVSERTLREVVRAHYGLAPKSLVMLGQLQDIRDALKRAAPRETVSNIAARHGVWDWGRFAQRYRGVYGESPSETLANHSATF